MTGQTAPVASSPLDERMPRIDSLTGMRWWAAFFVFTYHMLVFAPLPGIAATVFAQGFYGVTFFFVLSGFVLTWSASPRVSQSTFYWRRFARVYPAHFVALLLAIPVFYSFDPDPAQSWIKPVSVGILLLSVFLLQGWSNDPAILFSGNPAAWTLTCEAFFYALHPYISKVLNPLRQRGALVFIGVVVVIAFTYRLLCILAPDAVFADAPLPVVRLTEFAMGMGLAWAMRCGFRPRIPVLVGVGSVLAVIAAITLGSAYAPGSRFTAVVGGFANELVTVACMLAIAAIANRALSGKRSVLEHPILVKLGEWSFAFYLVHATVIYLALNVLGARPVGWSNLGWYAGTFVIALLAAAALHQLVERPIEKRLRAWKDNRSTTAAVRP